MPGNPPDAFDPFDPLTADNPEPDTSRSGREPASGRRWSVPPRPAPNASFPPAGRTRGSEGPAPTPVSTPAEDAREPTRHKETALDTLHRIALPELRSATARLAERGHEVSLDDRLADEQPALMVRVRPDRGPLAGLASSGSKRSGFEIRLGFERGPADPPDGTGGPGAQVIALEATGASLDRFTVLGQTPVEELTPSWVARRFVEFLERVLARS